MSEFEEKKEPSKKPSVLDGLMRLTSEEQRAEVVELQELSDSSDIALSEILEKDNMSREHWILLGFYGHSVSLGYCHFPLSVWRPPLYSWEDALTKQRRYSYTPPPVFTKVEEKVKFVDRCFVSPPEPHFWQKEFWRKEEKKDSQKD